MGDRKIALIVSVAIYDSLNVIFCPRSLRYGLHALARIRELKSELENSKSKEKN